MFLNLTILNFINPSFSFSVPDLNSFVVTAISHSNSYEEFDLLIYSQRNAENSDRNETEIFPLN